MDVALSKENICISRLVAQKKELIFIEEDMIVPDSKPDILNTINVKGNVCIFKKEVLQDKVKIEGNVQNYPIHFPCISKYFLAASNAGCLPSFSLTFTVNCSSGATVSAIVMTGERCEAGFSTLILCTP